MPPFVDASRDINVSILYQFAYNKRDAESSQVIIYCIVQNKRMRGPKRLRLRNVPFGRTAAGDTNGLRGPHQAGRHICANHRRHSGCCGVWAFYFRVKTDGAYLGGYWCTNRVERRIHCGFERLACPARPRLNREKIEHRRGDLT
jgi:hypothetical protein